MVYSKVGWNALNNLSTGHIIAISFFAFFIVCMIVITTCFLIYKRQLKKIYEIDKTIEILYRYPLKGAIVRLSQVNKKNDYMFDDIYRIIRIKYLTTFEEVFKGSVVEFREILNTKEAYKIKISSILKLRSIESTLEKTKTEFDSMHNMITEFLDEEYELRDIILETKIQLQIIERNYEALAEKYKDEYPNWIYPKDMFEKIIQNIYSQLNSIAIIVANGDYNTARKYLVKIFAYTNSINSDIIDYGKVQKYLYSDLRDELSIIEKEWPNNGPEQIVRTKNRYSSLKQHSDSKKEIALEYLKNTKIRDAKKYINEIQKDINSFKSELIYEVEIKVFFETNKNPIEKTMDSIIDKINILKRENSDEYRQNEKLFNDLLIKPISEIYSILEKANDAKESELSDIKDDFETQIKIIDDNLRLLNIVKTSESKKEKVFIDYLDLSFEIKTNLIIVNNILKESNSWMDESKYRLHKKSLTELYEELMNKEVSDYSSFVITYDNSTKINQLMDRMKIARKHSIALKQDVVFEYQMYQLSNSIIPILELRRDEEKITTIYQSFIVNYKQKDYENAVGIFIDNVPNIYSEI